MAISEVSFILLQPPYTEQRTFLHKMAFSYRLVVLVMEKTVYSELADSRVTFPETSKAMSIYKIHQHRWTLLSLNSISQQLFNPCSSSSFSSLLLLTNRGRNTWVFLSSQITYCPVLLPPFLQAVCGEEKTARVHGRGLYRSLSDFVTGLRETVVQVPNTRASKDISQLHTSRAHIEPLPEYRHTASPINEIEEYSQSLHTQKRQFV